MIYKLFNRPQEFTHRLSNDSIANNAVPVKHVDLTKLGAFTPRDTSRVIPLSEPNIDFYNQKPTEL